MIHYSHCPVCTSQNLTQFKAIKDHSVSKEIFDVLECKSCSLRFTQDIPDMREIVRYYQSEDYISHTDSKKGLFNASYQLVRSFALSQKRILIQKITGATTGNLLDYGCGTGAFLNEMKVHGWNVEGIEPDSGAREKASQLVSAPIHSTDALSNLEESKNDVITLWHVLEHVHELDVTVQNLIKSLKQDGKLVIAVPNYTSFDARHYEYAWAAYDVPRHLYHFSPSSLQTLLNRFEFKVEMIRPMWFDAFYVSMLSEKYKNKNLQLLKAIFIGFISNCVTLFNKKKCSSLIYICARKP